MKIYSPLLSSTCLLALLASPVAYAQTTCTPEHEAMGHCTMDAPKLEAEAVKPEPANTEAKPEAAPMSVGMACTPEHAAMGHCKMDEPKAEQPKKKSKAKKPKKAKKQASSVERLATSEQKPLTTVAVSTACTPEHAAMGHCIRSEPQVLEPRPAPLIKPAAKPVVQMTKGCTPEHAAMGHCSLEIPKKQAASRVASKSVAQQQVMQPKSAKTCTPEHAAMGHCTMPNSKPNPQVRVPVKPVVQVNNSCTPEHAAMGHCSMETPSDSEPVATQSASSCTPEHAAMGHCTMDSGIPVSDGSAETHIPMPYHDAMDMNDDPVLHKLMIDRLEMRDTQHGKPVILEAEAWFGKSIDKFWLKTDLEAVDGELEEAQVQVLYNRAISPFWDAQVGVRRDFKPAQRTWAVLGVQGTAPYFIDTNASLFLGESGQAALNVSAEKEVMLTQKTLLIPELALRMYAKDDHAMGVGAGLADLNLGLRLSHELKRELAPYIGVNWSKKFGNTADMAEHHGEKTQDTQFLIGIQAWF